MSTKVQTIILALIYFTLGIAVLDIFYALGTLVVPSLVAYFIFQKKEDRWEIARLAFILAIAFLLIKDGWGMLTAFKEGYYEGR